MIYCTNQEIHEYNQIKINEISGKLYTVNAKHFKPNFKQFEPPIRKDGRIGDTNFKDVLTFKIGCRVMLVHNLSVKDGLCNGAFGTVLGVEKSSDAVKIIVVKFDRPEVGAEMRKSQYSKKFPGGTFIKRIEFQYSLKRSGGTILTAKLIQFPLVTAFAITAHKFQGRTIEQPNQVIVDLRNVFQSAQAYVMLSRVQNINQLHILEKLPEKNMKASKKALEEALRLEVVSINRNPSVWDSDGGVTCKRICFFNARSIRNKFENIRCDYKMGKADCIMISETWLQHEDGDHHDYSLAGFQNKRSLNSQRGRGTMVFYKDQFEEPSFIVNEDYEIAKIKSRKINVINVYRSKEGDINLLINDLDKIIEHDMNRITLIGGDFNICLREKPQNQLTKYLRRKGFIQCVRKATHIDGGLIDHIYFNGGLVVSPFSYSLDQIAMTMMHYV